MGLVKLNQRLAEPSLAPYLAGLFPDDSMANMRFAINFFTSIGLGGITDKWVGGEGGGEAGEAGEGQVGWGGVGWGGVGDEMGWSGCVEGGGLCAFGYQGTCSSGGVTCNTHHTLLTLLLRTSSMLAPPSSA
jgi:hypothetical protein